MNDIFDKYLTPKPTEHIHTEEPVKYTTKPVAFGNVKNDKIDNSQFRNEEVTKLNTREDGNPIWSVSQSLIKQFTDKKNVIDYCPWKIYTCYIIKSHKIVQSLPMMYGNFFESLCIGGTAYGNAITDLPRKLNGEKTADQLKIEEQATNFKRLCAEYGITITDKNTQRRYRIPYEHEFKNECDVFITGVLDFEHPIWVKEEFVECVIDLKLTKSLTNTFGPHAWGNAEYNDHIQFDIYNFISKKPCLYWVFDYSKELNQEMFMHEVDEEDFSIMHQRIRQVIIELMFCKDNEWMQEPNYNSCKDCPHNPRNAGNCKKADNIKKV